MMLSTTVLRPMADGLRKSTWLETDEQSVKCIPSQKLTYVADKAERFVQDRSQVTSSQRSVDRSFDCADGIHCVDKP
jgi:hypothetical protein